MYVITYVPTYVVWYVPYVLIINLYSIIIRISQLIVTECTFYEDRFLTNSTMLGIVQAWSDKHFKIIIVTL